MGDDLDPLIARIAGGDRAAFRQVYARVAAKLLGIALRITADRAAAEDVVQEVFVELWRRADRYDPARGRALAWLAILTRSRALDALRRRGRGAVAMDDADLARLADARGADRDALAAAADLGALLACLKRLAADERAAVLLAYCEGLSREELAQRLGRPVNTVKTRLRRALIKLRGCLDGEEAVP